MQNTELNVIIPIVRRKLSEGVVESIVGRINAGEFPPDSLLPSERQLMEAYRVGRPTIREALQDLQRLGLLIITHGEGARVTLPTAQTVLEQIAVTVHQVLASSDENLEHLKESRIFFEVGMVRIAAARADTEQVAGLRSIIADMEAASTEFSRFMKFDMLFHQRIAEVSGNRVFIALSQALLQWLSKYHIGTLRIVGREARTLDEHKSIVDRIAVHDVDGAAAAMQVHLTRAADLYRAREEI